MRTLFSLIVVALLLVMPVAVFAHTAENPFIADLVADGGSVATENDVGAVLVSDENGVLHVEYVVGDPLFGETGWGLIRTHLHVAGTLDGIPQKKGNPPPGKFDYSTDLGVYDVELEWGPGEVIYIAAHADVEGLIDQLPHYIPGTVLLNVAWPGAASYFDATIADPNDGVIGTYEGWCGDVERDIIYDGQTNPVPPPPPPPPYTADVYSSYNPNLPGSLFPHPENLDLVNWILNQDYVGQASGCDGTYTYGDVQVAIWMLLVYGDLQSVPEDPGSGLGDWEECRVLEILGDAQEGEGFEPECGEDYVLILVPVNATGLVIAQIVLIVVPVTCGETAWGAILEKGPLYDPNQPNADDGRDDSYGYDFPGNNWAHFFTYTVQSGAPPGAPSMSFRSSVTTTWGSIKDR